MTATPMPEPSCPRVWSSAGCWLRDSANTPDAYLEELVGVGFGFGAIRDFGGQSTVPSLKPIAAFADEVRGFLKTCPEDGFIDVVLARRPSYGPK